MLVRHSLPKIGSSPGGGGEFNDPEGSTLVVTASDPTNDQSGGLLTVTLSGMAGMAGKAGKAAAAAARAAAPCGCESQGADTMTVGVSLPAGWAAGNSSSVTCTLRA